jgi:hypothetical protein
MYLEMLQQQGELSLKIQHKILEVCLIKFRIHLLVSQHLLEVDYLQIQIPHLKILAYLANLHLLDRLGCLQIKLTIHFNNHNQQQFLEVLLLPKQTQILQIQHSLKAGQQEREIYSVDNQGD